MLEPAFVLLPTTGLCAGVVLEFLPPVTDARLLIKINIYNQCLAMFFKPEPKLGYVELTIATTSSHTCTKPIVVGSFSRHQTVLKNPNGLCQLVCQPILNMF